MYIGLYKTPNKAFSCLVLSCLVLSCENTSNSYYVYNKQLKNDYDLKNYAEVGGCYRPRPIYLL